MRAERDTMLYPNVLASTRLGDKETDFAVFAETVTNNQDTVIKTYTYWHIPDEGEPVLMIEIDDEETVGWSKDFMDVTVRIRRNDGLIYEGNRASQENLNEDSCPESPDGKHQVTSGSCDLCGAKNFS